MNTQQLTVIDINENPAKVTASVVNITPTWGTIGLLVWRLIASREWRALAEYRSELARVFAMAQAFGDIAKDLTDAQASKAAKSMAQAMKEQGF